MLDFIFIIFIVLEIILTVICVKKLLCIMERIAQYQEIVVIYGSIILDNIKEIRGSISNLNKALSKVVSIIKIMKSKKMQNIENLLGIVFVLGEIIFFAKSLSLLKNPKGFKRFFYSVVLRQLTKKLLF